MRWFFLFLTVLTCLPVAALSAEAAQESPSFSISPLFDIRVRQEIMDGVYHFAPESDRNWIRFRTRAGAEAEAGHHAFKILLTNEHRRFLTPDDVEFDWDEIILDQAYWSWTIGPLSKLTVGRQNIIWDRGFLMLEGHPLDGSRSIYQNAVRYEAPLAGWDLDLSLIHNPKRDPIVLAGDEGRPLTDADETAAALRMTNDNAKVALIWKDEVDPDGVLPHLQVLTLGARTDRKIGESADLMAELALQYQKFTGYGVGDDKGVAMALQAHYADDLGKSWRGKGGFFFYSGEGNGMKSFRTPWGRWPKWSELYIYTLIGESTRGRIHVAAWENIAAPHVTVSRPLGDAVKFRFSAYYLLAPQWDWESRGALTQAELKFDILPGFDGHLLWEMLSPGEFHDGINGLEPLTSTVHFLRWQLAYALP